MIRYNGFMSRSLPMWAFALMAGAIAGAWKGFDALPKEQYAFFNSVNSHDFNLPEMATGLTKLAMESLKG